MPFEEILMKAVKLIPIKYNEMKYPEDITPYIQETSANFRDSEINDTELPYISLHTDAAFGYTEKQSPSPLLKKFPALQNSCLKIGKQWVPRLWFDKKWANEFSGFVTELLSDTDCKKVKIIEIHPPFKDYCTSFENFIGHYKIFEDKILQKIPDVVIHIENRCKYGTRYTKGKYLLASTSDIIGFSEILSNSDIKLRMVIDFPQLLTEPCGPNPLSEEMIKNVITPLKECADFIDGLHIWGKQPGKAGTSHKKDLDTYFGNDHALKKYFLSEIHNLFDDGKVRYFVPEVNSTNDVLYSIVNDFREAGLDFIEFPPTIISTLSRNISKTTLNMI
jgi:hypothetical protein